MRQRTSKPVSRLLRELYYQCTNVMCSGSYAAELSIVRRISPSAVPRADVFLPSFRRGRVDNDNRRVAQVG